MDSRNFWRTSTGMKSFHGSRRISDRQSIQRKGGVLSADANGRGEMIVAMIVTTLIVRSIMKNGSQTRAAEQKNEERN